MNEAEDSEIERQVQMTRITEEAQQDQPVYTETMLGQYQLKVRSKMAQKEIFIETIAPDGKKEIKKIRIPTRYKETLTEDFSTSFLSKKEKEDAKTIHMLLSSIKSFGESYNYDMSESYNMIADFFNAMVVAAKSTGEGSRTARSMYSHKMSSIGVGGRTNHKTGLKEKLEGFI